MKTYIARESATGDLYVLKATDTEDACRTFARYVLGMGDVEDTGNVDIDLYEVPRVHVKPVKLVES